MGGIMMASTLAAGNGLKTTARHLIQRAPAFWKHLWDNRSQLVVSAHPVDDEGKADNLMTLLMVHAPTSLYSLSSTGAECPEYLQHVSLYFLLKMTVHIDISTPEGGTLVAVLGSLRHAGFDLRRESLAREAFSPGSGIDIASLFLRFNQQLKRVGAMFNTPGQVEGLRMQVDVLSLLQELMCQDSIVSMIGRYGCYKETITLLTQVVRSGISPDNVPTTLTLWSVCENIHR
ncbi:hypothetical protein PENSPDRAFT_154860 [Peniophora sp. CONT]|nr:hypothetical protein PENSPDRAFT_154860 [Peniophora sp. CONT]